MTPLLPLDLFRQQMQLHPYHFWQLANSTVPVSSQCDALVYQYAWQNADAAGRSEIIAAIETAEDRLREWLGYSVAPHYVTETLAWPQYHTASFHSYGPAGLDGHWRTVQLAEGYVQAAGTELLTTIQLAAAVVYTDTDGDGVDDTFTVTAATTITDASQVALYFVVSDLPTGNNTSANWRIQPIQIVISAGTATIKGPAWIMVKPKLYQGVVAAAINPATAGNLATTVNVYQRTTTATAALPQATLIWDTLPWPACASPAPDSGSSTDPNAIGTATGRVGISDSRRGIVHIGQATYDSTTGLWNAGSSDYWRPPDRVTVRYLAGYPLPDTDGNATLESRNDGMAQSWQTIVARLAAAELSRPICACASANRELYRWQEDLARTGGNNDAQFGAISAADLDNPFGTRRGHVYAWRQVNHLRTQRGLFAG